MRPTGKKYVVSCTTCMYDTGLYLSVARRLRLTKLLILAAQDVKSAVFLDRRFFCVVVLCSRMAEAVPRGLLKYVFPFFSR